MEFPTDLRLPLRSLLPFAGSSSKTPAIPSIFRFSPPKFASTKLSPPPQKATGPDPIGTRSFFKTNLWFSLTLDPPSTGDQHPKTDDFFLRRQRTAHSRIRRQRRRERCRRHSRRNHRLEAPVKRQRKRSYPPQNRGQFHPSSNMRDRCAQPHDHHSHCHSPYQRPQLARAAHQPLPDNRAHDNLREI